MTSTGAVRGFSLPELLITLAVLGIVTQLAVAAWREQVQTARRSEALALLLHIMSRQEQFRLQALRYADGAELSTPPPDGLGIGDSNSSYRLATTATASDYSAIATVRPDGPQADDSRCWLLGIDSSGRRWAENRAGTDTTAHCWRR